MPRDLWWWRVEDVLLAALYYALYPVCKPIEVVGDYIADWWHCRRYGIGVGFYRRKRREYAA